MQPQPKYKAINFPNLVSLNEKLLSPLANFGWLGGWGGGLSESVKTWKFVKICDKNLYSENVGLGSKKS